MAWYRKTIETFLDKQKLSEGTVTSIKARLAETADGNGLISAGVLETVMGDPELARTFEQAWETDPSLHSAHS